MPDIFDTLDYKPATKSGGDIFDTLEYQPAAAPPAAAAVTPSAAAAPVAPPPAPVAELPAAGPTKIAPQDMEDASKGFQGLADIVTHGVIPGTEPVIENTWGDRFQQIIHNDWKYPTETRKKIHKEASDKYVAGRQELVDKYGLKPDEVDDVVKHLVNQQPDDVSTDALGQVHYKRSVIGKNPDEIIAAIAKSNLPQDEKKRQIELVPQRVQRYKSAIVADANQNRPELAEHLGLTGDDEKDWQKIDASLNTNAASQGTFGLAKEIVQKGTKELSHVMGLFQDKIYEPPATETGPNAGTIPAGSFEKNAQEIAKHEKISKDLQDLSHDINKKKVEIWGQDAAVYGEGAGALAKIMLLGKVGGEFAELAVPATRIAEAEKAAKVGWTALKGALSEVPMAATFATEGYNNTYDEAIKAGKTPDEASGLAAKTATINMVAWPLFGATGHAGVSDVFKKLGTAEIKDKAATTLARAITDWTAGTTKMTIDTTAKMLAVQALDTVAVQAKINPEMTEDQFKESLESTLKTMGVISFFTGGISEGFKAKERGVSPKSQPTTPDVKDTQRTPGTEATGETARPAPADAVPPGDVGGGAGGAGDVAGPAGPDAGGGGPTTESAPKTHRSNIVETFDTEAEAQKNAKFATNLFKSVAIRKNEEGKFEVHKNAFEDVRADERFISAPTTESGPISSSPVVAAEQPAPLATSIEALRKLAAEKQAASDEAAAAVAAADAAAAKSTDPEAKKGLADDVKQAKDKADVATADADATAAVVTAAKIAVNVDPVVVPEAAAALAEEIRKAAEAVAAAVPSAATTPTEAPDMAAAIPTAARIPSDAKADTKPAAAAAALAAGQSLNTVQGKKGNDTNGKPIIRYQERGLAATTPDMDAVPPEYFDLPKGTQVKTHWSSEGFTIDRRIPKPDGEYAKEDNPNESYYAVTSYSKRAMVLRSSDIKEAKPETNPSPAAATATGVEVAAETKQETSPAPAPKVEVSEAAPAAEKGTVAVPDGHAPKLRQPGTAEAVGKLTDDGVHVVFASDRKDADAKHGTGASDRTTKPVAMAVVDAQGNRKMILFPDFFKKNDAQRAEAIQHERIHFEQHTFEKTDAGGKLAGEAEQAFDPKSPDYDAKFEGMMKKEYPSWDKLSLRDKLREGTRAAIEGLRTGKTSHFAKGFFSYLKAFMAHVAKVHESDTSMSRYIKGVREGLDRAAADASAPDTAPAKPGPAPKPTPKQARAAKAADTRSAAQKRRDAVAEKDAVAEATKVVLEPPGSTVAKLTFGDEKLVGETKFTSRTTARGRTFDFSLFEYELKDGRKRFIVSAGDPSQLVDAAALVKLTPDGPEIEMLHKGVTGFDGLGGALAKEISKRYGKPVVQSDAPLSKATKKRAAPAAEPAPAAKQDAEAVETVPDTAVKSIDDIPDEILVMAKAVADGRAPIETFAAAVRGEITALVPMVKNLENLGVGSESANAKYLRAQLKEKEIKTVTAPAPEAKAARATAAAPDAPTQREFQQLLPDVEPARKRSLAGMRDAVRERLEKLNPDWEKLEDATQEEWEAAVDFENEKGDTQYRHERRLEQLLNRIEGQMMAESAPKPEPAAAPPTLLEYAKSKLSKETAAKITEEKQVESFRAQWEKDYPPPAAPVSESRPADTAANMSQNGEVAETDTATATAAPATDADTGGTVKDRLAANRKKIADHLTRTDRSNIGIDNDLRATRPDLAGVMDPKESVQQEKGATSGFTTGIKNAVADAERIARSKDPIAIEMAVTNMETGEEARSRMDADPNLADALVGRIRSKIQKGISTVEQGILLLHKVDMMTARDAEMVKIRDTSLSKQERDMAGERWDSLEEKISQIDEATHASGAEWGRLGQFRQRLMRDDYSFEALERKDRQLKGRPLTKEESGQLEEMAKDHAAAKAEVDRLNGELAKVRQEKETLAYHNEVLKELGKYKEHTGPPTDFTPPKKTKPKVVEMADSWIESAMKRKAERRKAGMMFSNPVPEFADDAIIGTAYLVKGAYKFGEWSAKMVESLGDYIKPHLEELWEVAKTRAANQMKETPRDIPGERKATVEAMKEAAGEGATIDDLGKYAKALHRQFIEDGMTDFHRIKDAIHAELEQVFPGIIEDESLRAWTDYGKFSSLDYTDPNEVLRRTTRQEGQKYAKIQSLLRGEPPERTGREMQQPSVLARTFEKQAKELARQLGIQVTDPETQLKSSLDAIKTRLKNAIADMDYAISTGKRMVTDKTTVTYDAEATQLKAERDAKKAEYDAMFPKEPITPEEQLRHATKIAERNAETWQKKLDDASAGNFSKKAKPTPVTSPELAQIRANIEASKAEVKALRDLANPKKSDTEKALASSFAAKQRRIADLQDRIARKDFAPRAKKPAAVATTPAEKALESQRDAAAVQQKQVEIDYKRARAKWEQSQQGRAQRTMEGIVKWNRAFLLTGLHSIAKLTSAAGEITAFAPVEQAVGAGIGKAMPGIAERAPSKGRFQFSTEGKAVVETFRNLMKDAKDILKTGNSDLDLLYGKPDIFPPEFKDYIGRIHAALKSPAKRNQWVRSFEYRMQHAEREAARNGLAFDPKDPMTQLRIGNEAYKEALSSIFYDDNLVVSAYKWALNSLEQHKDPATGQMTFGASVAKMAARFSLPIVRIPTNIVARTFEYSLGTGMGTLRIGRAAMRGILGEKAANGTWKLREGFRRGIDELHPDEANAIIRNLARGSLGGALLLVGFFNPQAVGGYYVRGQKRDESEVKEGELRLFGHNVKKYFIHNPLLEQLQIGSTIRKVMDSKLRKKDVENQGITPAIKAAAMGLIDQVPFVSEMDTYSRLKESEGGTKFIADTLTRAVPQLVKERAKEGIPGILEPDTDYQGNPVKRDPKGLYDRIKMNIPGMRQSVPVKKPKSLFKYGSSETSSGKQLPWKHEPVSRF